MPADIIIGRTPPLRVQLPDGRIFTVPAATAAQRAECDAINGNPVALDGNAIASGEKLRRELLRILTRGSALVLDDGRTDAETALPLESLDAVGEIELLHGLIAYAIGLPPEVAIANQRTLLSRAFRNFLSGAAHNAMARA